METSQNDSVHEFFTSCSNIEIDSCSSVLTVNGEDKYGFIFVKVGNEDVFKKLCQETTRHITFGTGNVANGHYGTPVFYVSIKAKGCKRYTAVMNPFGDTFAQLAKQKNLDIFVGYKDNYCYIEKEIETAYWEGIKYDSNMGDGPFTKGMEFSPYTSKYYSKDLEDLWFYLKYMLKPE